MSGRILQLIVYTGLLALTVCGQAAASVGPQLEVTVTPNADYVISGGESPGVYKVVVTNVGDEPTSSTESITIENTAPSGTTPEAAKFFNLSLGYFDLGSGFFSVCPTVSKCVWTSGHIEGFGFPKAIAPGQRLYLFFRMGVPANVTGTLEDKVKVSGGGIPTPVEASGSNMATTDPPFGQFAFHGEAIDSVKNPYVQAGGHPFEFATEFNFGNYSTSPSQTSDRWETFGAAPIGDPDEIVTELPPGFIVNPQAVPTCKLSEWFSQECSKSTAVGSAGFRVNATEAAFDLFEPMYNLQPSGNYPGQLGITVGTAPFITANTRIRDGSDYGVSATSIGIQANLTRVKAILWGVPAEAGHDSVRGVTCQDSSLTVWAERFLSQEGVEEACANGEGAYGPGGAAEVPPTAFISMPTDCSGEPLTIGGRYNTWQQPGLFASDSAQLPAVEGCNQLTFEPTIEAKPTTKLADSPSGLSFRLHIPQNNDPEGVTTPALKASDVTLPKGLTLNPGAANELGSCSEAQIGLHSEQPAHCPDASKLGVATVRSNLLHEPLHGAIYLATPHKNPGGALVAVYVALEGEGIRIKLRGTIETDPATGQLTTRFDNNPQLPLEDLQLEFFGGARGLIRTPAVCGSYETTSSLTPYSAPESGPPATPHATFTTEAAAREGEACPTSAGQLPSSPLLRAGTETPQAGVYSPFSLRLSREPDSQEIASFQVSFPPGLVGRLAGIPYCADAALAAAASKTGAQEKASPSCPAASEVGTVDVGAGAGPAPINIPGRVYLAGPYKGAPLSLVFINPVIAGPLDLGTSVVRAAVYLDPETVQNHVVSDPLPTILQGIPLDIRSITVKLDRPGFTLNPTNCEELHFTGNATSVRGTVTQLSDRFQLGGCAALRFKPRLRLSLSGGIHRNGHPRLRAVVTPTPGGANLSRTEVVLPPTEFFDDGHLRDICTSTQFKANECPKSSIYGRARAETPLLPEPLEGPVFLQPSSHRLPDLVAALHSGAFAINLHLHAREDSVHSSIRTTFEGIPDVPLTRFVLNMAGGGKGILVNSKDLCAERHRFKVRLWGHNGKSYAADPPLRVPCNLHQKRKRPR